MKVVWLKGSPSTLSPAPIRPLRPQIDALADWIKAHAVGFTAERAAFLTQAELPQLCDALQARRASRSALASDSIVAQGEHAVTPERVASSLQLPRDAVGELERYARKVIEMRPLALRPPPRNRRVAREPTAQLILQARWGASLVALQLQPNLRGKLAQAAARSSLVEVLANRVATVLGQFIAEETWSQVAQPNVAAIVAGESLEYAEAILAVRRGERVGPHSKLWSRNECAGWPGEGAWWAARSLIELASIASDPSAT